VNEPLLMKEVTGQSTAGSWAKRLKSAYVPKSFNSVIPVGSRVSFAEAHH